VLKLARIAGSIDAALRERGVRNLPPGGRKWGCSPAQSLLSAGWSRTMTPRSRSMPQRP
jgi:hypothetical protein